MKILLYTLILFIIKIQTIKNDIDKFFASLKSNRKDLNNKVSQFSMPEITIIK